MAIKIFIATCFLFVEIYANSRIVNGTDALEGEFPYVVSLRYDGSHTCGGTILNSKYILTAAHCVCSGVNPMKASMYSIQYDLLDITKKPVNIVKVKQIHCNKFNPETLVYDAAVLELHCHIPKGKWSPVKLSEDFVSDKQPTGTIVGWGRLYVNGPIAKTLQKLDVDIYDEDICGQRFNNEHHICFGAPVGGACNGDSGTALIINGRQVGIASFITDVCGVANKDTPNIYSKVATYHDWIAGIAGL